MEKYELLYIIPAKYTEPEIDALMEKVKGVVSAAGGNVSEMHNLGKRKLAYPISHVRHGNYILVYFEAETDHVTKLNDILRLSTDFLRHLIVIRNPYLTKIPSILEVADASRRENEESPLKEVQLAAPIQQKVVQDPMSMAELDKKLDEILTEEVL